MKIELSTHSEVTLRKAIYMLWVPKTSTVDVVKKIGLKKIGAIYHCSSTYLARVEVRRMLREDDDPEIMIVDKSGKKKRRYTREQFAIKFNINP